MLNRYFVNIEPIEPSGFVLTVEALPRLLIFGETIEDALRRPAKRSASNSATRAEASSGPPSNSCRDPVDALMRVIALA